VHVQARAAASEIEDAEFNDFALVVIAVWQAAALNVPESLKKVTAIEDAAEKARSLCEIVMERARAGDLAGAAQTSDRAQQAAATIENARGKASVLSEIAAVQAKVGDCAGALKIAATIVESASWKAGALLTIADEQARAGDVAGAALTREQALLAAATIADASDKSRALHAIAEA
jgi:hypothetical protein